MPSGPVWASIKRIRGTINEYTGKVAAVGWYAGFKPPTVGALQRRLLQHEVTVESHSNVDMVIGFRNLVDGTFLQCDLFDSTILQCDLFDGIPSSATSSTALDTP